MQCFKAKLKTRFILLSLLSIVFICHVIVKRAAKAIDREIIREKNDVEKNKTFIGVESPIKVISDEYNKTDGKEYNEFKHRSAPAEQAEWKNISYSFYEKVFRPSDSEIKFYNRPEDDHVFRQSQINESRIGDDKITEDLPMTPEEAIRKFGTMLPSWERYEILNYPNVYYLGLGANKTQVNHHRKHNFGFDYATRVEEESEGNYDVTGHYKTVPGDHIGYRYEIIKHLDNGYYTDVILARDWSNPTSKNIAIKIFRHDSYMTRVYWREVSILQYINSHATNLDYFTRLLSTFKFRNHFCMVLELLGQCIDLKYMKHPVRDMKLMQKFANDTLHGLRYLHEINMVHGDIKPHNIMYIHGKNSKSEGQLLKIADFGGSCILGLEGEHCYSSHFVYGTRIYRSPEIILRLPYTTQCDMFSFGISLAELYLGHPPFYGEDDESEHLGAMMEVLGLPPTKMVAKSHKKYRFFNAFRYKSSSKESYREPYSQPLVEVMKGIEPVFFDLICRCLEWDPQLRITPEEALQHPFVTTILNDDDLNEIPPLIKRFIGEL